MKLTHSIATLLLLTTTAALATPTGLNNIPTADTVPQETFVFQLFSTVGGDADADLNLGFKTGVDFKFAKAEFGLSSHLYPGKGGPVTPHGKLAVPLGEHLPTLAIGAANVTFRDEDRARAGDEFFYAVASEDLGWFRVHAGCGLQDGDALPFVGLDKTFRIPAAHPAPDGKSVRKADGKSISSGKGGMESGMRDLFTVRADAIELRSHDWLYSAGVLIPVCKYFVFETWGNFPSDGASPSLTLKANFVLSF